MKNKLLLSAVIFLVFMGVQANLMGLDPRDNWLEGEFWVHLPFTDLGSRPPFSSEDTEQNERERGTRFLLEEARFVFSAMIYGLEFRYVPSDKTRDVAEEFSVALKAEVSWGDPNLRVVDSRMEEDRLYTRIRYMLREYQLGWLRRWDSSAVISVTGSGTGTYGKGWEEKITSYKEALKNAAREYLRKRVLNKPKRIAGEAVIAEPPHSVVHSGAYNSRVRFNISFNEVVPYSRY